MKKIFSLLSWVILVALIIIPPILHYSGSLDLVMMKNLMVAGTVAWFIVTPLWMWSGGED